MRINETNDLIEDILSRVVPGVLQVDWRIRRLAPDVGRQNSERTIDDEIVIERVEEWTPGDTIDDIASAETGWTELVSTQYRDQQPHDIRLLMDASPVLNFGSERVPKRVLAAEIEAGIIAAAEQKQDNIGLNVYTDHASERTLPSGTAREGVLREALWLYLALEPKAEPLAVSARSGLCQTLENLPANRRCLVFVISDFSSLSAKDTRALSIAADTHAICCVLLSDRREEELPAGNGVRVLNDLRTGQIYPAWLTNKSRAAWQEDYQRARQSLLSRLRQAGCHIWQFRTGEEPAFKLAMLLAGEQP